MKFFIVILNNFGLILFILKRFWTKKIDMNRYELIKLLLDELQGYENSIGATTLNLEIKNFIAWLSAKYNVETDSPTLQNSADHETPEVAIARLAAWLYHYAKTYSNHALEGQLIANIDEFTYTTRIFFVGQQTKSELIASMTHEKTTGMEIIRRLVAKGILRESEDPSDGRSKLLHLTDIGRNALFPVLGQMEKVAQLVGGLLTTMEKRILVQLMQKLADFHEHIHKNERLFDLDAFLEKYIKKD
jgi:MarR family transcriptional regulator, lower aerobic nicotinate degradation pathway regulator